MEVKVLIIRAPGTNCDEETKFAFEFAGASVDKIHIKEILEKPKIIHKYHIFCIPGGFTYGDDIASAKILALKMKYALIDELQKFKTDGKLILGICNGFQVLVKSGFLENFKVSLVANTSGKFEDRWVHLKVERPSSGCTPKCKVQSIWTKDLPEVIDLPVAHGEGRFVASQETIKRLKNNGQIVFSYADETGTPTLKYPMNPNGSLSAIAGICDETGRVLGLMPHPERYIFPHHHPECKSPSQGIKIIKNAVKYISSNF